MCDVVANDQYKRAAVEMEDDGSENACNRVVPPPHRLLHEDVVGEEVRSDHVSHSIIRPTATTRQRALQFYPENDPDRILEGESGYRRRCCC